jgi:hypothetical protein
MVVSQTFGSIGLKLHSDGWPVIPIKKATKEPAFNGWQNGITTAQAQKAAANGYADGNIGLLASLYPGADIDVTDDKCADAIAIAMEIELGSAPVRVGSWPKRLMVYKAKKPFSKIKVYLKGPKGEKDEHGKRYAIEFLATGQQYIIYGKHPDGHDYRWEDGQDLGSIGQGSLCEIGPEEINAFLTALPKYLPKGWSLTAQSSGSSGLGSSDALALYKPPLPDWDIDRVRADVVPYLSQVHSYDEWLKLGMILHHQGQGDIPWMELWDELSQQTDSYDRDELVSKWHSFSKQRPSGQGAITLASLIKEAGEVKKLEQQKVFDKCKDWIENAVDLEDLKGKVVDAIKSELLLDHISRGVLAHILKSKFKEFNFPVSIADAKNLIKPKIHEGVPEWLADWVYVTHEDRFFNVTTKRKVTAQGFNAMFNRFTVPDTSSQLALELWQIPTPDKCIYLPVADDLFELNGVPCANEYNKNSPPDVPETLSQSDLAAIEIVKNHLALILTEPNACQVMMSWLAHNVQFPGVKIRWAPLIKGIEGDGKSVLGNLLMAVMGHSNVGIVSPSVLGTGFTQWAAGRCVNVLEEIRMVGHNRHDVLNTIKPYIANDQVTIHPKGVNEYVAPNTVNYIAFTNHTDALPLEDTDRRWWVQFTPFHDENDLRQVADGIYFAKLFDAIKDHAPGLRKWLLDHKIDQNFNANGRAPASRAKDSMVSLNVGEDFAMVKDLIETGGYGFNAEVISSKHLNRALSLIEDLEVPKTHAFRKMLMKLGYTPIQHPINWDGVATTVWLKNSNPNFKEELSRARLNEIARGLLDVTREVDPLG